MMSVTTHRVITCNLKDKHAKVNKSDYRNLKSGLRKSTAQYGLAISTAYFIAEGAEQGISVGLGAVSSYLYVALLSDRVENIEKSTFPLEFLAPISLVALETTWNNANLMFEFDYGCSFIGFLAYKFALSTVIYEVVREMLAEDGALIYEKKLYETIFHENEHDEDEDEDA